MNILVTGACGQLGMELRRLGAGTAHRFLFADLLPAPDTLALDILDTAAVMAAARDFGAGAIINCAAYNDVPRAESDSEAAYRLNRDAVQGLAGVARELGAVLVHISSDYIFDGQRRTPYPDNAPGAPLSVYGSSKLAGEQAVRDSGCKYLIFRTSWLYSPYGKNFLKTTLDITSRRPEMRVVNDQRGTPTYAADLAGAILCALERLPHGLNRSYNYSDGGAVTWYGFARAINELSGHGCRILPCSSDEYPSGVRRPAYSVLDKRLVKRTFALSIPHWKCSLSECLERMSIL